MQIIATKVTGTKLAYEGEVSSPMIETTKSIVPPRYNTASTLEVDVKHGRNEDMNFELTSRP